MSATTMTTTMMMITPTQRMAMRMGRGLFRRAKWMDSNSMWDPQDTIFACANPVHSGIPRAAKTARSASFVTSANPVRRSAARRKKAPTSATSLVGVKLIHQLRLLAEHQDLLVHPLELLHLDHLWSPGHEEAEAMPRNRIARDA